MDMNDLNSFQARVPPSQYAGNQQRQRERTPRPAQQQYQDAWDPQFFDATTSFSSQDCTWPLSLDTSFGSSQDVAGPAQHSQASPGACLDLRQFHKNAQAADNVDLKSLVKPVNEDWLPPSLASNHATLGYQYGVGSRSSGVMSEPYPENDIFSAVDSEALSTANSGFYSVPQSARMPSNRHDSAGDDRSEYSAVSGAQQSTGTRPRNGRTSSDSQVGASGGSRRRASQSFPPCPYCKNKTFIARNRSEHLKHERKHTKPFKCIYPECIAKDVGFSTDNDRDRHYKSGRHNQAPTKGSLKGYVCIACDTHKPKWWPRQDNFKAHCKRRHGEFPLGELMKASEQNSRPANTISEDNNTVFSDESYQQTFQQQPHYSGGFESELPAQGEEFSWFDHTDALLPVDQLAGVGGMGGAQHLTDPFAGRRRSIDAHGFPGSYPSPGRLGLDASAMDLISPGNSFSSIPRVEVTQHDEPFPKRIKLDDPFEWEDIKQLPDTPSVASAPSPVDPSDGEGPLTCPECGKSKKRRCELTKHMKRHTRPYGCTFPSCHVRHGSRSDWKRHEEHQHVIVASWKCTISRSDGIKCFANLSSEVELRHHLIVSHGMSALGITPDLCESMLLGEDGVGRFWCGFCRDVVEQFAEGNAREGRMRHIGDHFDKQDRTVLDYVCLVFGRPFRELILEERGRGRDDGVGMGL